MKTVVPTSHTRLLAARMVDAVTDHTTPADVATDLLDAGWRVIQGKSGRGSGYSKNRANGRRERLWLSPACHHAGEEGLW